MDPSGRDLDYVAFTARREKEDIAAADALRGVAGCITTIELTLLGRLESGSFTSTLSSILGAGSVYFCWRVWAPYVAEDLAF
jgi:hypothetical protein